MLGIWSTFHVDYYLMLTKTIYIKSKTCLKGKKCLRANLSKDN